MELHQTKQFLHINENYQQNEKAAYKNGRKYLQMIHYKELTKFNTKKQKVGRGSPQIFFQRYTDIQQT